MWLITCSTPERHAVVLEMPETIPRSASSLVSSRVAVESPAATPLAQVGGSAAAAFKSSIAAG